MLFKKSINYELPSGPNQPKYQILFLKKGAHGRTFFKWTLPVKRISTLSIKLLLLIASKIFTAPSTLTGLVEMLRFLRPGVVV